MLKQLRKSEGLQNRQDKYLDPQTRQNIFLGGGGGPENKTNDRFAANISRKW